MARIFQIVQDLYDEELYQSVVYLGSLLLSSSNKFDRYVEGGEATFKLLVIVANALCQLEEYHRAENMYRKAIAARSKLTAKENKKSASPEGSECESDLYFKLSKCLIKMGKTKEALGVLEAIPAINRTAKVKLALWKLYNELGPSDSSGKSLHEAWTSSPCALDLLALLLQKKAVQQNTAKSKITASDGKELLKEKWFEGWLGAQWAVGNRDYSMAIDQLDDLSTSLNNNVNTLVQLATTYDCIGEKHKAISVLQRTRNLDCRNTDGMDKLAALLCVEKRSKELETLATSLMSGNTKCPEPWIAFAYLCKVQKKLEKALYFAAKACDLSTGAKMAESLLVKARVLIDLNKRKDALEHLNEARYLHGPLDIYETAVQCHMDMNDTNQALAWARYSCQVLPCPRADTLMAYALMKTHKKENQMKARGLLESAVNKAPYLLNAVLQLAENYDVTDDHEKAVNLLRAHTLTHPDPRLHRMLGDFLSKSCADMAIHSYRFCLTMDPHDTAASSSMHDIDAFESSLSTPPCLTPVAAAFTEMIHQSRDNQQQTESPISNVDPDVVMSDTF